MLHTLNDKIFSLSGSVLGFEELNEFRLVSEGEDSPYATLQSIEQEEIGFLVASPFDFYPEYEFEVEKADKQQLNLTDESDVLILGIITLREPVNLSTMNLLAPIIMNVREGVGRQVVLPPKYVYGPKTSLFRESHKEESGDE